MALRYSKYVSSCCRAGRSSRGSAALRRRARRSRARRRAGSRLPRRAELGVHAVQLHVCPALEDEVDLLGDRVIVALGAAPGGQARLGQALQDRAAGRQAEQLADRRAVLRRERRRGGERACFHGRQTTAAHARRRAASAARSRAAGRRLPPSASSRSAAAATCSGGSRWMVERWRARSCSAARARETEPPCSNQHTRTSPKPALASSLVSSSADGKRARSTARRWAGTSSGGAR